MGHILLAAALAAATLMATVPARAGEQIRAARVGEIFLLKFPGNRDGGYLWRLNKEKSTGLERVAVKDVGWTIHQSGGSILFRKASVMSISVLPKAPGKARLVFEYVRHWSHQRALKTEFVQMTIRPKNVAVR